MDNESSIQTYDESMSLEAIGGLANKHAEQHVFSDYQDKSSTNTQARQKADMKLFCLYLSEVHIQKDPIRLLSDPLEWLGITHGLVTGFVRWQLLRGYAIGSINVRLSTVKRYCELATAAGAFPAASLGMIKLIKAFKHKDGRNIDQGRQIKRIGHKKASPVALTSEQVTQLKHDRPDTPQGARDAFLLCLLFDHALRRNEVALLTLDHLNLETKKLIIYREKTDETQIHLLTPDTYQAARRYYELCLPGNAEINPDRHMVMGGNNKGQIFGAMSDRAITKRVNALCKRIGVSGASAHDGRHYCATALAAGGTDVKTMMEMCNWKSPSVAIGYINAQKIANENAKYGEVK